MSFYKACQTLKTIYYQHNLDAIDLSQFGGVVISTSNTIEALSNTLDNYSRAVTSNPNHRLKIELGKLSYNYLQYGNLNSLSKALKRVEFLGLVLNRVDKACILARDPDAVLYKTSSMVVGIEGSALHQEKPCCNLFGFFGKSEEVILCNEVSEAVGRFNQALQFDGLGCSPSKKGK